MGSVNSSMVNYGISSQKKINVKEQQTKPIKLVKNSKDPYEDGNG